MLFESVFRKKRVCGVDTGASGGAVYVCAHSEGGKDVFETVPDIPSDWDSAVALSPRGALIRRIDSPFPSAGKTRRVLPSLLDVQMPFSLEECSVAFTHMEPLSDGRMTTVASAARIDDLRRALSSMSELNIDPMYVDVEGIALWEESIRDKGAGSAGTRVAVLKAEQEQSVLVLGTGSRLISAHPLSSFDASHVKRLLVSAYGVAGPIEWRICGGNAEGAEYRTVLDELGTDWVSGTILHDESKTFLARAVARRALVGGCDVVNLRQDQHQHPELTKLEDGRIQGLAAVLAGCGLLLGMLSLGANIGLDSRMKALDDMYLLRADKLAAGSLGPAKGIHALQTAERIVGKRLKEAAPILAPFQPSPAVLLREIGSSAVKHGLLLEVASVTSESVSLEGTASSWKNPEQLERFLQSKGMTTSLTRDESLIDESVKFKISASGGVN